MNTQIPSNVSKQAFSSGQENRKEALHPYVVAAMTGFSKQKI